MQQYLFEVPMRNFGGLIVNLFWQNKNRSHLSRVTQVPSLGLEIMSLVKIYNDLQKDQGLMQV